jgi:O-acetyl-ADP-ribose deacetylase (regulator of RNase III)
MAPITRLQAARGKKPTNNTQEIPSDVDPVRSKRKIKVTKRHTNDNTSDSTMTTFSNKSHVPMRKLIHTQVIYELIPLLDGISLNSFCKALEWDQDAVEHVLLNPTKWRYFFQTGFGMELPPTGCERNLPIRLHFPLAHACHELSSFLALRAQYEAFCHDVHVIEGDVTTVTHIDGQIVEGIIFPTSSYLGNTGTGSCGAVYRREGVELSRYISILSNMAIGPPTYVRVTPGFSKGMKSLIHCSGPQVYGVERQKRLYDVYISALNAVALSNLSCVVAVSISTGAQRYPIPEAAEIAMRAVCDQIRLHNWRAKIGFVCIDPQVFREFVAAKKRLEQNLEFFVS